MQLRIVDFMNKYLSVKKKEACEPNYLKLKTDGNPVLFILYRYVKNGKIYSARVT